jgi:peptidoglycan/xylan/chitin deacetylase (PgdA/CDA1 family)
MMKKSRLSKIRPAFSRLGVNLIVLAIFILPLVSLFNTFKAGATHQDQRKVFNVEPLHLNARDKQSPRPFEEPIITVEFDDGWESVYTQALPVLQQYGIPTTQYIIAGEFNNPDYMSYKQVVSLKKAGHDIGSHTVTHPNLTTLDDTQLLKELAGSKNALEKIQPNVDDLAVPYGATNPNVTNFIKKYYRSDRLSDGSQTDSPQLDVNVGQNFDAYKIHAFAITRSTNLATLQNYIDYTKAHNGWLILVYHQINNQKNDEYSMSKNDFINQMQVIKNSGVNLATESSVMNAATNKGGK